ncbi:MAG TPA: hypothetical protein VKE96_30805 [Vicinamibacterales bacterium]|nr:hypothetical protein [Vicinamibacterales bacterium]
MLSTRRRRCYCDVFVGIVYVGIGAFGLVYRNGDPFMAMFVVPGGLLLISGYVMSRPSIQVRRADDSATATTP